MMSSAIPQLPPRSNPAKPPAATTAKKISPSTMNAPATRSRSVMAAMAREPMPAIEYVRTTSSGVSTSTVCSYEGAVTAGGKGHRQAATGCTPRQAAGYLGLLFIRHPERSAQREVEGSAPVTRATHRRRMRVVLQRVSRAEVRVGGRVTGRIDRGFLLLVGFTHVDGEAALVWMADKIVGLRLFADGEDKMNLALTDVSGALLVVSQFTLYGDAVKGRRPSFIDAARPETAIPLYERFVDLLRARVARVETGEFGAMMDVDLVNDGPVTLLLER